MWYDPAIGSPDHAPLPVEEWRRILFRAADILDHVGWITHAFRSKDGYCAVGAIAAAAHGDRRNKNQALRIVNRHLQPTHLGLISWNDTYGRSAAEVIALLREVATRGEPMPGVQRTKRDVAPVRELAMT